MAETRDVDQVYADYRDRLNQMSFGYPPTESGVEFVMLKELTTPEDAEWFLKMDPDVFFTAGQFAERTGEPVEKVADVLMDMSKRGIVYREDRDGTLWFHAAPAAHGLYEFNGNRLEPTWVGGLFTHFGEGLLPQVYDAGIPFYRSMPINADVVKGGKVLPYDDVVENVNRYDNFALCNCTCRDAAGTIGARQCEHDRATCITTGKMADYYVENGIGKPVTKQEVLDRLKKSVEQGMIIQTCFSKAGEIICSCAVCCCGILQANKMFPGSGTKNITHYRITCDKEVCDGCGKCAEVCPMQAITMDEETNLPVTDGSCVGCGQCAAHCPTKARILVQKPEEEIVELPDTVWDAYVEMEDYRAAAGMIPARH